MILALCGNKSDMYEQQEISLSDLQQFSNKHNIELSNEASAKNNTGVNEIFQKIVQRIDQNKDFLKDNKGFRGDTVRLGNDSGKQPGKQKKKCKC